MKWIWLAVLVVPAIAQTKCEKQPELATQLGIRRRLDQVFGQTESVWYSPVEPGIVRYVRVRIGLNERGRPGWLLHVRDEKFRLLETLSAADFPANEIRWTPRLVNDGEDSQSRAPQIVLDLVAPGPGKRPLFRIEEYIVLFQGAKIPYYSRQDPTAPKDLPLVTFRPTQGTPDVRRWGDALGLLVTAFPDAPAWACSGVLIGRNLFLTNWHCGGNNRIVLTGEYWNSDVIADTFVDLSWDGDAVAREFQVTRIIRIDGDQALDFAVLELAPLGRPAPVIVPELRSELPADNAIYLLHHPEGKFKHYSSCGIERAPSGGVAASDFAHRCDSEGGSSGGPVFDGHGRVVGLHHLGFTYDETTCKSDKLNKAVRMSEILPRLLAVEEVRRRINVPLR